MKKIALDERVKYRLTGVLVIVSIAVIFLPAMIKRSNQHLSEHVNVSVKLPPKPVLPHVAMVQEKTVFSEIKVARVEIPEVAPRPSNEKRVQVAFDEPAHPAPVAVVNKAEPVVAKVTKTAPVRVELTQRLASNLKATLPSSQPQKITGPKEAYAVQLAAFSQKQNALALVARLRGKGYTAAVNQQGGMYKVVVTSLGNRDRARLLQKKLAETMQMTGLIVRAQVS